MAFYDQRYTRTGESVLDFRYVSRAPVNPAPFTRSRESIPLTDGKHLQGHQWYLQSGAGEMEKRFLENLGNVVHLSGPLGVRFVLH